ncbi:Allantoinase [Pirellulimonas nuda]|uniref:allantoinase n=1 Tax=Pirellulimonas nuda TaxID=2528009 RepID=A0A518DGZ3_9BACT|nr:allantoinase AllB [Pirellulimonas nuda]QDU90744.1 Allantoinase [Pirellulimonas nuda]
MTLDRLDPELVLSSRRVVLPGGERPATVVVRDGRIVEVRGYDPSAGDDLGRLALLPGLIDPHVHLNEPGRTEWEGFASGTAAAASGGVTTLIDMPLNSSPVTTTLAALQAKRAAARGAGLWVDVGFHAGLVPGNLAELPALLDAGVMGVKSFLCDSGLDEFPAVRRADLAAAMPLLADRDAVLLAHAEVAHAMPPLADPRSYADYLASRPAQFEQEAIALLVELCESTGCRTHIVHLADADALPTLAAARGRGLPITVETCPHYLTFAAEEIADGATAYKCAPPIRDASHRERLWQGLADGVIDLVASDHSPCPPEMKSLDEGRFDLAWGGVSSLQLGLPAVWAEAQRRGHTLADVAGWMCDAPARLLGLEGGVRVGAPANLVVFDPDHAWAVDPDLLLHRHKITPYAGRRLRGGVVRTYLRGQLAAAGKGDCL